MAYQLEVATSEDYSGALALGAHPDGSLEFENGTAVVDDETLAKTIVDRYPNITLAGTDDTAEESDASKDSDATADSDAGDDGGDNDSEFDAAGFVDRTPMDDVIEDIESGDYDDHLDAILAAATREGVKDALEARRTGQSEG